MQADEVSLPLRFELQEGFVAGNPYEVFYLPSRKLLISARLQMEASPSQQVRELTNLLGKAFGVSAEELGANHNGDISFSQKVKILKGSGDELAVFIIFSLLIIVFGYFAAFFDTSGVSVFWALISFAILLFLSIKFKLLKQFQEAMNPVIEKIDGVCSLLVEKHRTTGKYERTYYDYFFVVSETKIEVSERQMTKLAEGAHLRVFYSHWGKRLVSVEAVNMGDKEAGTP